MCTTRLGSFNKARFYSAAQSGPLPLRVEILSNSQKLLSKIYPAQEGLRWRHLPNLAKLYREHVRIFGTGQVGCPKIVLYFRCIFCMHST
ncbi:Hypothetical protein NGAL_HAMBI490_47890 [Neorhizobium galegae bv. officinalis]|nr:Hypothetical protein NGAL_HAMBI490_47890 [Neorhizobium galegae bv. officinalis]